MAAKGGPSPLLAAIADRRMEYLSGRTGRNQCDRQSLSRFEISRCAFDRSADVARAPNGPEPGRGAAREHLFQALSCALRPVPVGLRADHSLRSDADWKMVLR